MSDWLFSEEGKAYLQKHYIDNQMSTYAIAEKLETYPNKVRRALLAHHFELRDSSTAQAVALATGRHPHPTRGRSRTEVEKEHIGDGVAQAWWKLPDDEKMRRAQIATEILNPTEESRLRAAQGLSRSAREGSRLELSLLKALRDHNFAVRHRDTVAGVVVDLYFPNEEIAVLVGLPGDNYEVDELLKTGRRVIIMVSHVKNVTGHVERKALGLLLHALSDIVPLRRIEVEHG